MPQTATARPTRNVSRFRCLARPVLLAAAITFPACDDDALPAPAAIHDAGQVVDRGATWADARDTGRATIRVLYVPAAGFAERDAAGEPAGVTVGIVRDFVRWVREQRGVDVEIDFVEEPDWRTFYGRVRAATGGVFGLGNVTITEARRAELRFSPPYMTNVAVLITHERVPELASLDEIPETFAGMRPLAFAGTLHERRLAALRDAYLPGTPLAEATSNAEILERTALGPDYFAYIDGYNFWRAAEAGAPLRQHDIASDASEAFGIIMPLDNDWAPLLDEYFAADGGLRARPSYRALLREHLGEELAALLLAADERSTSR
jgi:ABC-type amino acid transport substrate-binding protein